MLGLFLFSLIGLSISGYLEYNSDLLEHQESAIPFIQYLSSSHFFEAVFENWESEFLQMWSFVILTAFLYQKGSSESKKIKTTNKKHVSSKFHFLRENSLGLALLLLFIFSFILHGVSGHILQNQELRAHGEKEISLFQYFISSKFWFESFQNWQSEFLSVWALIILSIFLRQKGSPESKPVSASNAKTGS
jgi:hypothetical protein